MRSFQGSQAYFVQENKTRAKADRDLAAEHYLRLMIIKRRLFWQVAPFFKKHCPNCWLWRAPFLDGHRDVFERWCNVQLTFCDGIKHAIKAAECSLGMPVGYSPLVAIGNQLLLNMVGSSSFGLKLKCL